MFELTVDVSGTDGGGGPRSPAFVIDRGSNPGFEIALAERPLFGDDAEQLPLGQPLAMGSLFSIDLGPATEDITSAIDGYTEIDPLRQTVTASSYWEAVSGETILAQVMSTATGAVNIRFATQRTYRESIRQVDDLIQHLVPVGIRSLPEIAGVYHDGMLMAEAGGSPTAGSWSFADPVVTVYGSPSAPYHGEFDIVVVESVSPEATAFWVAFWADWADDFIPGQIVFMGDIYVTPVNPLLPQAGDFLVSQGLVYLFCERLPFTFRAKPAQTAPATQFFGEVGF